MKTKIWLIVAMIIGIAVSMVIHTIRPVQAATLTNEETTASLTPKQFIPYYFQLINERDYDKSWSLLTSDFKKRNNPDGFKKYKKFWNTTENVEVYSMTTISHHGDKAKLKVEWGLYSTKYEQSYQYTSTYNLIFDKKKNSWLFN
jgi:serine/threonine protein kinase, bacterial